MSKLDRESVWGPALTVTRTARLGLIFRWLGRASTRLRCEHLCRLAIEAKSTPGGVPQPAARTTGELAEPLITH
ncbi:hypothetical protein [Lentzea aerocolonigenes]|uniref:hypothetical protein n=1 Tax=Lentzea aerocolonigenes TaxID=68170 RepID=UPI0018C8A39D|nr:hypothetical protein [Lentzea aerocolonigenes]